MNCFASGNFINCSLNRWIDSKFFDSFSGSIIMRCLASGNFITNCLTFSGSFISNCHAFSGSYFSNFLSTTGSHFSNFFNRIISNSALSGECFSSYSGSCCKRYGSVFFRIISNFFCFSSYSGSFISFSSTSGSCCNDRSGKSSLFQRPYVQPVRQTIRRLVLLQPPRCTMDTDQKPYGRSTSDNLSNGLMYSLTYSFNSSGTGVFVFAVVGFVLTGSSSRAPCRIRTRPSVAC